MTTSIDRRRAAGDGASDAATVAGGGRAVVLCPVAGNSPEATRRLDEARGLAVSIGLEVASARLVVCRHIRPSTYFGTGQITELRGLVEATDAALFIADCALSPVQQRNLEKSLGCKVIDRTGLILEIFGERARTREGRLQVELAHLTYQKSRLVRSWTHLERQRGGFGFMGGPGERQIETDRRLISARIVRIRRQLEKVRRTRGLQRKARKKVPYPVVALVGYTNAGKSTLFNRLTGAAVEADARLFATLDPTMRGLTLPSGVRLILSDTVGFISDLPTALVAAFRATLEEVLEADIILHVRDIAAPGSERRKDDVLAVLAALGIASDDRRLMIDVLNKVDRLPEEERHALYRRCQRDEGRVALSAADGEGCERLLAVLDGSLCRLRACAELTLGHQEGEMIAWLYRHGEVLERRDDENGTHLKVRLSEADLGRLAGQRPDLRLIA